MIKDHPRSTLHETLHRLARPGIRDSRTEAEAAIESHDTSGSDHVRHELGLAENPHRLTKPLSGELPHRCSARPGDYRILLRLDDQRAALWIIRGDHRAHAYQAR